MKRRELLTFDMTPLIDVIFLLLIFFLVSTTMKTESHVLKLNLPNIETNDKKNNENLNETTIEITEKEISLNGIQVDLIDFEKKIQSNENKKINIYIDKSTTYNKISLILNILNKYKLNNLILIQKE